MNIIPSTLPLTPEECKHLYREHIYFYFHHLVVDDFGFYTPYRLSDFNQEHFFFVESRYE